MLVEFRVRNFRSLRNEQTLSFLANNDRTREDTNCIHTGSRSAPRLTRCSVVYGSNGSGKSNLVLALATMRSLVLHSTSLGDAQFAEHYTPFRLDVASAQEPIGFELTLLVDGVRYEYGFEYDSQRIRRERLVVYRTGKGQRWFERSSKERAQEKWAPFSAYFNGPREAWRRATGSRSLFLTTAVQLSSGQLKPLFDWIMNCIAIVTWRGTASLWPTLRRLGEPDFKRRVLELLRMADLRIADIRVDERPGHGTERGPESIRWPDVGPGEREVPLIWCRHEIADGGFVELDNLQESAGTLRLLAYLGPLLEALDVGKLLVIDELGSSLHPMLTRLMLRLAHDPRTSMRNAQLFVTTYDTSLLDTGILRRDQVWFVEKDSRQASRVYPLADFSPRKHEALERGYLRGRYGALPLVSSPGLPPGGRRRPHRA